MPNSVEFYDARPVGVVLGVAIWRRLSFTQSIGCCPGGRQIPGWKGVFFNPLTNAQTIDAVINTIQSVV